MALAQQKEYWVVENIEIKGKVLDLYFYRQGLFAFDKAVRTQQFPSNSCNSSTTRETGESAARG